MESLLRSVGRSSCHVVRWSKHPSSFQQQKTYSTNVRVYHQNHGRPPTTYWKNDVSLRPRPPQHVRWQQHPTATAAVHGQESQLIATQNTWVVQSSRWLTTDPKETGSNNQGTEKSKALHEEQQSAARTEVENASTTTTTTTTKPGEKPLDSSSSSSSPNVTAMVETRLKHIMELSGGDQLAVVGIATLFFVLIVGPYLIRRAQKDSNDDLFDDFFSAGDVIDDLTKLSRTQWSLREDPSSASSSTSTDDAAANNNKSSSSTNALEYVLSDVLQSQALQQAAQQFVVQTLQSEPVKAGLQRLLKELFFDLVNDPETVAQIVKLLQFAIQNPDVRNAAQQLVLDIVAEPDVQEALVQLVQRLGQESDVQLATQELLTESAHHALNDPEILDHSMEFATDVLGDDIVQRTAGEALRNTVGHAVRPATTVVLTALGVGLMILGVVSLGYARSSESEAILYESAARSLQSNAAVGMMRIVTWPLRAIQHLLYETGTLVLVPVRFVGTSLSQFGGVIGRLLSEWWQSVRAMPSRGSYAISEVFADAMQAVQGSIVHYLSNAGHYIAESTHALLDRVAQFLTQAIMSVWSKTKDSSRRAGDAASRVVSSAVTQTGGYVLRFLHVWSGYLVSQLTKLHSRANDHIERWALMVEEFLQRGVTKPAA